MSVLQWTYLLALLFLLSCGDENEIRVYRIPKSQSFNLKWSVPSAWNEETPYGMRKGSFLVKNLSSDEVDISVIYLEGQSGGDLPNVNRWRDQIGLSPWTYAEFQKNLSTIDTMIGTAQVVDFSNDDQRIIAAMIPKQQGTWFVKMIGQHDLVENQKGNFIDFLKKLKQE